MGWFSKRPSVKEPKVTRRRIDLDLPSPNFPIYAIGDIHGCFAELKAAEARIAADIESFQRPGLVVLLGDYVDRGPSSCQVLDHLIRPSEFGLHRLPLCGNHDDIFLKFLRNPKLHPEWLRLGGQQTLLSYGIDLNHFTTGRRGRGSSLAEVIHESVPATHLEFLTALPICLKVGEILFVHAGIMPGVSLEDQRDGDMLWIREPFLTEGPRLPLLVVHGHTPKAELNFGPNRIGVDTGAYYSGQLAVLKIDGGRARLL